MAIKLAVAVLAALTIATACSEKEKRQAGASDLNEYFNQFQEQMKPITGQFPSLPSGQFPSLPNGGQFPSLPNGQLPSLPNGFGSLPSFPGMGSSGSSNSQFKRQAGSNPMSEWFNQLQEVGSSFSGNNPFKPFIGQFPFPGSSSGSSETSGSQNP